MTRPKIKRIAPLTLVAALKKLAADNLANLTPHPFYVFMTYSHPPMIERLAALEKHPQAYCPVNDAGCAQICGLIRDKALFAAM